MWAVFKKDKKRGNGMYYKIFKATEISPFERVEINKKFRDFVVDMCDFLPPKHLQKRSGQKLSKTEKPTIDLDDLRAERIPGAIEPKITKPKNNIFDEENNERLLKEFREAGIKTDPEPKDTTNII